jgi:phosphoribosylanthranilate isomerase
MIWLKVCGITRRQDAEAAVAAGASAIGFVFWNRSPRCVGARTAREIGSALPAGVERAGVFVDACREEILRVFEEARLSWVQLQGEEDLEFACSLGVPWVKAFRVGRTPGEAAPADLAGFAAGASGGRYLLDAFVEGTPGGTGHAFDWDLAAPIREAAAVAGGRMILAGGLEASNVAEAVARALPDGVDVSGGVESAPGIKDAGKIRRFARALAFEGISGAARAVRSPT